MVFKQQLAGLRLRGARARHNNYKHHPPIKATSQKLINTVRKTWNRDYSLGMLAKGSAFKRVDHPHYPQN